MTRIREAILVEGRYDVNTVRQVVDTVVLESGGFRIFNNKDQLKLLRRIAETRGLIVLTDSDGAGFVIRNYLKGALPKGCVKQAYVPDIAGKERRKRHGSKEGKLGVEGMRPAVLLEALRRAGATFADEGAAECPGDPITKADLFALGLTGGTDSAAKRRALLKQLDLPEHLTPNGMLEALNLLYSREEFLSRMVKLSKSGRKRAIDRVRQHSPKRQCYNFLFVCDNRQKEEIEVRAFLVGRRPCRGVPVDYFLLVEEWDALWGVLRHPRGERRGAERDPRDHRLAVWDACRCCPS